MAYTKLNLENDTTLTAEHLSHIEDGIVNAENSAGIPGKDGVSATHSWNGTTLTITSASGTSSANLVGPQGPTGEKGLDATPVAPLFADSVEECEDTTKPYVLPDGFIYTYKMTEIAGGAGYTNLVPTSTDTDGSIYNGTGYKDNVRLSSSGGVSGTAQTGSVTTGFIPCKNTDIIRMKGAEWVSLVPSATYGHYYIGFYDSNKTKLDVLSADGNSGGTFGDVTTYDETTNITTFDLNAFSAAFATAIANAAYFRINAYGKGADLIVTVNEEIKEASGTVGFAWTSTGHAFVHADYEDRILALESNVDENTDDIEALQQQVSDILDGNTAIAASTKFDPTVYRLPILYLTGSTTGMTKENAVTLSYVYGDNSGSCTLKWQGSSSLAWDKKNYTIKFASAFEVVEGWGSQSKYCLKANWIDHSHARNVVSAKLWGLIRKNRSSTPENLKALPNAGAIDGFPVVIMLNGEFHGLYSFNIPKDAWMFGMGSGEKEAIVTADNQAEDTAFKAETVLDADGLELEYSSSGFSATAVKDSFNNLINACINSTGTDLDSTVAQYLDWESAIDYYIFCVIIKGGDMVQKNAIYATFDGVKWYLSAYDMDTTYGLAFDGSALDRAVSNVNFVEVAASHRVFELIKQFKTTELKARYNELRDNILSETRICQYFENYAWDISSPILLEDVKKWPSIRGSSVNGIDQICRWVRQRLEACDKWANEL